MFISVSKQGSTLAGIMDAFAISVSMGLQHGVPLATFVRHFTNMRFEPAGMTDDPDLRFASSLVDYIFRRLAVEYMGESERQELGIMTVSERMQPTLPGVEEAAIIDQPIRADFPEEVDLRGKGEAAATRAIFRSAGAGGHATERSAGVGDAPPPACHERRTLLLPVRGANAAGRQLLRLPVLRHHQRLFLTRRFRGLVAPLCFWCQRVAGFGPSTGVRIEPSARCWERSLSRARVFISVVGLATAVAALQRHRRRPKRRRRRWRRPSNAGVGQHSVRWTSTESANGIKLGIVSDVGPAAGSQVITWTQGPAEGVLSVVLIHGTAYLIGDPAGLYVQGFTSAAATAEANKWIAVKPSSAAYASAAAGLTISSALAPLKMGGSVTAAPGAKILGMATVGFKGTSKPFEGQPGSARGTLPSLERDATTRGGRTEGHHHEFDNWGEPIKVTAPLGAVPIQASWLRKVTRARRRCFLAFP